MQRFYRMTCQGHLDGSGIPLAPFLLACLSAIIHSQDPVKPYLVKKNQSINNMQGTMEERNVRCPENWEKGNWQFIREYCPETYNYLIYKRIMDVVTSLIVIVAVFPWLLPIVVVLIKIDSKGPVLFKQKRVGFLGKSFWCYKFRTMYVNDYADTRRASNHDPRVTRVGRFLRNTCLDELPQFFNVLLGHMSIVGPRPHMLKDTKEFSGLVDNYSFRHLVRPGITGLSQVRGYRGPATTFESIFRRYQWDAYYVRNVNHMLDLRIMAHTVLLMVNSLLDRDKPVPIDTPAPTFESRPLTQAASKKIA
jgi:putative colanic acid biosysnthesis UDP-glucose lipid carrier transferase